jgi:hypothetical protein
MEKKSWFSRLFGGKSQTPPPQKPQSKPPQTNPSSGEKKPDSGRWGPDRVVPVEEFMEVAAKHDLIFEMPDGFVPVAVKENPNFYYQFAIYNKQLGVEMRYTIQDLRHLDGNPADGDEDNLKQVNTATNLWYSSAMATGYNLSGQMLKMQLFEDEAVRKEFHAHYGGTYAVEFKSEFGKGYSTGQLVYLRRVGQVSLVISFLSNDLTKHMTAVANHFHTLKYK